MPGIIKGSIMLFNIAQPSAPSILAASLTDSGICWICAMYTIIIYPDNCHTVRSEQADKTCRRIGEPSAEKFPPGLLGNRLEY